MEKHQFVVTHALALSLLQSKYQPNKHNSDNLGVLILLSLFLYYETINISSLTAQGLRHVQH